MNDNLKYSQNPNLWRKTYAYINRKPKNIDIVYAETSVTQSVDSNVVYRHRDYYLIPSSSQ